MKRIIIALTLLLGFTYSAHAQYPQYLYGIASWYGSSYDGSITASGEIFDSTELTAAHQTLPFGTLVEVENLANGNTVTVEINDRGPYVENRIIDVSEAAASVLGFKSAGTAYVKVTILELGSDEVDSDNILDAVSDIYDDPTSTDYAVTNVVTQTVTETNYVVVTNTAFGYNETVVERSLNTEMFVIDTNLDFDDQFITEEPFDDPVLPSDDYVWTPDVENYFTLAPPISVTSTNTTNYYEIENPNVVDLGIPGSEVQSTNGPTIEPIHPDEMEWSEEAMTNPSLFQTNAATNTVPQTNMNTNRPPMTNTVPQTNTMTNRPAPQTNTMTNRPAPQTNTVPRTNALTNRPVQTTNTVPETNRMTNVTSVRNTNDSTNSWRPITNRPSFTIDETNVTPEILLSNDTALYWEDLFVWEELSNEIDVVIPTYETNSMAMTNMIFVTNYLGSTNTVSVTNYVRLTNAIPMYTTNSMFYGNTNAVAFTNAVFLTNAIHLTNLVSVTNSVTNTVGGSFTPSTGGATQIPVDSDGYTYAVQVGAFTKEANAIELYQELLEEGFSVFTTDDTINGKHYTRVRVGYFGSKTEAYNVADDLEDLDYPTLIVKLQVSQ